jgi:threonine dehydrogenase-like Zn-dependent dehydrogenase
MKDMMKALIFPKPWKVDLINIDIPKPKTNEVLALDLIASKKLDLQQLITKRITLEEAINAFKFYNREKWIKVIVEPQR